MSSTSGLGTSKKRAENAKYCLDCDKRIVKTSRQAKSNPRKIGNIQAAGYLKYLEANGKFKSKQDVLDGHLCSPCYTKYQYKYKGQYDPEFENRKKLRTNTTTSPGPEPEPGTSGATVEPEGHDPSADPNPQTPSESSKGKQI